MKERVKKSFVCKNCNCSYWTNSMSSKFCCDECRKEFKVKDGKEILKDYVMCRICNRATANVTGVHLRNHPGWTAERYHSEFPNSQVIAEKSLKKIKEGSVKAGSRMREPEHRERMSKSLRGKNNPMHTSNTSVEKRKSISPFSSEFYLSRNPGLTQDEAEKMAKEKIKENKIVSWPKQEYWIKKGYTEDEAKNIISEKQATFSLEKCIFKHGEIKGTEVWKKRQEKWAKNYKKSNYSKNSQKLFSSLYSIISVKYRGIYFATLNENKEIIDTGKNHEYRLSLNDRVIMPDFYVEETKKIIEFDGVYWHDYKRRNKRENEKREIERDESILNSGYKILRISELEWEKFPLETVKKCLDYLIEDEKNT